MGLNPIEALLHMLPFNDIVWELINAVASSVLAGSCMFIRFWHVGDDRWYLKRNHRFDYFMLKLIRFWLCASAVIAICNWGSALEAIITGNSTREMYNEVLLNIAVAGVMVSAVVVHLHIRKVRRKHDIEVSIGDTPSGS